MRYQAVWVHGNSARIENPENLTSYNTYGWGTDVTFRKSAQLIGYGSWFHVSIPSTLSIPESDRSYLLSVEILFYAEHCTLDQVDIYDGSTLVHSDTWRPLSGEWRFTKDDTIHVIETEQGGAAGENWNTYNLRSPRRVFCGIGVSFHVHSGFIRDERDYYKPYESRLIIASVGANFRVESGPNIAMLIFNP